MYKLKISADNSSNEMISFGKNSSEPLNKKYDDELIEELKPLLNSQRIERLFGSYGVDVMHQDDELRISNLYSLENGEKIMRTCALVNYSLPVSDNLQDAHEIIVAGGSIGSTLKNSGFRIDKKPVYFGSQLLPDAAKKHMGIEWDFGAVHIYKLCVSGSETDTELNYCTIIEIHSPEYLTAGLLEALYSEEYFSHNEINSSIDSQLEKISNLEHIISGDKCGVYCS